MTNLTEHWDQIFQNKSGSELGWFEAGFEQTLKFIRQIDLKNDDTVFVPGAGTSQLVDELHSSGFNLILNDLSAEAIRQTKKRLPDLSKVQSFAADISKPMTTEYPVDLWLDRAVLHFLLEDKQIQGYFDNVKKCVKPGGHVLLAEFAKGGAEKCAGLDLKQYDITEMQNRLGPEFHLVAQEKYTFINPFNQERPYIYGLFKRNT